MKNAIYFIAGVAVVGGFVSANGESLLKAASFPKTFNDVPFVARMEVLADDYKDYEPIYNAAGRCVSGCAYPGITIEDENDAMTRNTQRANDALDAYVASQQSEPITTLAEPTTTQAGQATSTGTTQQPGQTPQFVIQNEPGKPSQATPARQSGSSVLLQTCSPQYVVKSADIPWNSPIAGDIRISSDFGPRKAPTAGATSWHKGIDISVPTGTPVYATANGTIEYIRDQGSKGAGKYVVVKHGNSNFRSAYFHLSNNQVLKVGDTVRAGDIIGISGNSGASTGEHLDYRVFYTQPGKAFGWGQDAIDPLWTKNYMDTQYRFKSQATKSCLHNPRDFCVRESATKQTPPETLPCEAK